MDDGDKEDDVKKKVLMLLMVALAAGLFAMAWTGAWFTATKDAGELRVATGELSIGVGGATFKVENLMPGEAYEKAADLKITNTSTCDVKWRMRLADPNGNPALADKVWVRCTKGGDPKWVCTMKQLEGGVADAFDVLAEGADAAHYTLEVRLDESADNDLKEAWCAAKVKIEATQAINPGWEQ